MKSSVTSTFSKDGDRKSPIPYLGLWIAIAAAVVVELLPLSGITIAGQHMLAILIFAVIVWITEALDYTVSAILISALIIFLVGTAPDVADPTKIAGTGKSLRLALTGFSNSAAILVAVATFIAVAMTVTGLDRRIALLVMSRLGASSGSVLVGAIIVTVLLSLIVPSATARVACVVPIMMGVIAAFKIDGKSRFAASIMIVVAQATSVWNIGIQTAAAQNLLSKGYIEKILGPDHGITWGAWLLAGAPWAIIMSFVLYFVVRKIMPPEIDTVAGGKQSLHEELKKLGPITKEQIRLLIISLCLLGFWATEKKLHSFDTTSTTIVGLTLMLLPGIGVMNWQHIQKNAPWGTIIMFAIGISLGGALLDTQAAQWLADLVVKSFHLETLSALPIFIILASFLIIIHLGFASATALTASLLPIMITVLTKLPEGTVNVAGMSMLLAFTVSFGFILPTNAPQNMVCMGTQTFTARQFFHIGIWLTVIGFALMILFALTWWKYLGWM
ncbi:MAG: anion permease [Burkholderiales bacterium]|jgi:anion transporter|nr:anion permease [Burkholderiales bacterium]